MDTIKKRIIAIVSIVKPIVSIVVKNHPQKTPVNPANPVKK